MALTVTSCKDDDTTFNVTEDLDRLPMPMFRRKYNTNIADENDMYASRVMDGYRNRIQLHWYGVKGAAGYEIRYGINIISDNEETWRDPARNVTYVTLPADQLSYELKDLSYNTDYSFCIRALHPDGKEEHHSKWYGMGGGRQWEDYLTIRTNDRYAVPNVISWTDKDYDGFTVLIDPRYDRNSFENKQDADTIEKRFNIVDGKFQFTHLVVKPSSANPNATVNPEFENYPLDINNLEVDDNGYLRVKVTGLDQSSLYNIALRDDNNTKADAEVDRYYNDDAVRTKGDPGPAIRFPHSVATEIWIDPEAEDVDMAKLQTWFDFEKQNQACRLDTLISNFNGDKNLAENQVFLLDGDKTYYLQQGPVLSKGFVLMTNPDDIAAGKGRAKVFLGARLFDINDATKQGSCNWQLGKEKGPKDFDAPIRLEKIIFDNIDFDCPGSYTSAHALNTSMNATGNYFANMLSNGLPVQIESFEIRNCTFQGIRRGFFRIQGGKKRVIDHLIIDNNVLMNCGYYSNKGVDYNIVHGQAESREENICADLQLTNNTFYDTPLGSISPTKNNSPSGDFADGVQWDIKLINNTFINHCTRSDSPLLNIREVPDNSKITFKNNLICLTKDANDKRRLGFCGIDIRNIHGHGNIQFDICNNYSASSEAEHRVPDGIITNNNYRFSATKNAPGFWWDDNEDHFCGNSKQDLVIQVGSTPLMVTDIFADPNPRYHATEASDNNVEMHAINPDEIWSRLSYKTDSKLIDHEIYKNNVGAPRWKSGDPKNFYIAY